MKCDIIAEGIIEASRSLDLKVPVIVRLEGTNVERGKKLLEESGLALITADDLDDAATSKCPRLCVSLMLAALTPLLH